MKKPDEEMDDEFEVVIRPRQTETISIKVPKEVLASLKKVAESRDMSSYQALIRLYIGQGLRQDLSKFFGDKVLETAEQVLVEHIQSKDELSSIIQEIRDKAVS